MGAMLGLFGKKVACFQCEKKAKLKESHFRRHMRFCSAGCEETYVSQNPMRPSQSGSPEHYREEAVKLLTAALSELVTVMGGPSSSMTAAMGLFGGAGGIVGGALAMQRQEEAEGGLRRYDDYVLRALPYLYALGRADDAAALEREDLEDLYDNASAVRTARKRLEPIAERIATIATALGARPAGR